MGWETALITGGMSILGDLLGDNDAPDNTGNLAATGANSIEAINAKGPWDVAVADIMGKKAYAGQKDLAKNVAPYLWENLEVGLTEQEKQGFRGAGRTSIADTLLGTKRKASSSAASQGLKGGSIANILSGIDEQKVGAFAGLESDIAGLDMARKKTRMDELQNFLSLNTYKDEGSSTAAVATAQGAADSRQAAGISSIADIINNAGGWDASGTGADLSPGVAPMGSAGDLLGGQFGVFGGYGDANLDGSYDQGFDLGTDGWDGSDYSGGGYDAGSGGFEGGGMGGWGAF